MLERRRASVIITVFTMLVALLLAVDRGGLIAWTVLVVGAGLLAKFRLKPSAADLRLSIGLAVALALVWFGTLYYVITTYESGEVVELAIDTDSGVHTARLWVFDIEAIPVVYYDAAPAVADSLLAGRPVKLTRAHEVSVRAPNATAADELSEGDASVVLEAMETKYGDRMLAANIYYLMLGRSRDRVALVVELPD